MCTTPSASASILSPLVDHGASKFASYGAHAQHAFAVRTFIQLGLPDILSKYSHPVGAIELADAHDMNAELLFRLLRIMVDNQLVDKHAIDIKALNLNGKSVNHADCVYKPEYQIGFTLTEEGKMLTSTHPSVCIRLQISSSHPHLILSLSYPSYSVLLYPTLLNSTKLSCA
jgi:hypothetical protein